MAAAQPLMRLFVLLAAGALAAVTLTCATSQNPNAAKYPPRGRRCHVSVYETSTPGVKDWDDLGVARVECPLDVGRVQCMARLREEACRMGGDLLYDVPRRGARPGEQAMVFMGHVAHPRLPDGGAAAEQEADAGGEAAFDTSSPVEPLSPTPASPPPADAGRD
jgi:hypothetical protein